MDTTVSGIGAVVVAELRAAGYMESTVGQYAKTIKALTEFASGREYSTSLGAEFASMRPVCAPVGSACSAGSITDVWLRCSTPMCRPAGWTWRFVAAAAEVPRPGGADFVALDAAWEAEMGRRGLAPATREAYGRVARSYLLFLEARGIAVLDGADGASVLAFLESLLDRWTKSSLLLPPRPWRQAVRRTYDRRPIGGLIEAP